MAGEAVVRLDRDTVRGEPVGQRIQVVDEDRGVPEPVGREVGVGDAVDLDPAAVGGERNQQPIGRMLAGFGISVRPSTPT